MRRAIRLVNIVSAGLLLFWGVYFSMAGTGNLANWLSERGYHGRLFRFSSKNFELIDRVAKRHGTGESSVKVLFAVIMSWEILSAVVYFSALVLYLMGEYFLLQYAFFVGMGLFAGLILGNEAFVYYEDEEEHVVMFLAQLVSYVAVVLL